MIQLYKRYVLWGCAVMSKIPGYRWLGRLMLKHYTRNFWRTWLIVMVSNILAYFGTQWLLNRWIYKQEEDLKEIINSNPVSPTKTWTDGILKPSFDHMK